MLRQAKELPRPGARRRKGEGHGRREEILSAAQFLFLSEGYEKTTVRRLAEKVGVTPPVLYRHFKDKDEILLELCDRVFGELVVEVDQVLATEADPIEALRRMAGTYIRFGLDHPDEYRLVFMVEGVEVPGYNHRTGPAADADVTGRVGATCFAKVAGHVAKLVRDGDLRPGDPLTIAELIWVALHGLVSMLIARPNHPWSDREKLIDGMIDMTLDGFRARK